MRKSELEARIERLEAAGGTGKPLPESQLADLASRIDALDERVAEVELLLREAFEANEASGRAE